MVLMEKVYQLSLNQEERSSLKKGGQQPNRFYCDILYSIYEL